MAEARVQKTYRLPVDLARRLEDEVRRRGVTEQTLVLRLLTEGLDRLEHETVRSIEKGGRT